MNPHPVNSQATDSLPLGSETHGHTMHVSKDSGNACIERLQVSDSTLIHEQQTHNDRSVALPTHSNCPHGSRPVHKWKAPHPNAGRRTEIAAVYQDRTAQRR